ncbi:MAG: hypothetical protein WC521_00995 [Bdellovibrionales bacterium]|jgi:hypothetical protein
MLEGKIKPALRINAFLNDVLRVFQTPFVGLPFVIWFYFILCYIALPSNPVWLGILPDGDDYTYLSHTIDWLQGQGWFDPIQHRMSPPEGVALHYTRFAEMPIAALIMLFRLFGYTWQGAALLGSFVLPVLYLGLFFWVLRKTADRFVSQNWSRLTAFIALFAPFLMFKFAPGQVDHHGLETILTLTALGLTTFIFERPDQIRWAVAASGVFALSTAIGLEVLPWMTLTSAVIGVWTAINGRKAARSALAYGAGLFVFGAVFLALDRSASVIFKPDLLSYSIVYVALMGGIALSLFGAAGAALIKNVKIRILVCGVFAAILGVLYLHQFPALLAGPYGAMDEKLAALLLSTHEEALPLMTRLNPFRAIVCVLLPILGFAYSICRAREEKAANRWKWILIAVLLGASISLGIFYQIRMMIYAELFSIIPLAAFAQRRWAWIGAHYAGRRRFWAEIWLVLLIGPLTTVFLFALQDGRSFNVGVLMFPAQTVGNINNMRGVEKALNAPPYAGRRLRIMNMVGDGAELLFTTPHEVMAAPYHTNVRGNLESINFFSAIDEVQAEKIARRNNINLVLLSRFIPEMYLKAGVPDYVTPSDKKTGKFFYESFMGQLVSHEVPNWLKEIPLPKSANYQLFEVVK